MKRSTRQPDRPPKTPSQISPNPTLHAHRAGVTLSTQSEKSIVEKAKLWLRLQPDCWAFKVAGGPFQTRGIADLVGHVHGKFLWAEAKRPGKSLTENQIATAHQIQATGGKAFVFHSLDEFRSIIDDLRNA